MPGKKESNDGTIAIATPVIGLKSKVVENGEFMQGVKAW
jgi:hypothetical protein